MFTGIQQLQVITGIAMLLGAAVILRRTRSVLAVIMLFALTGSALYWEFNDSRNVSSLEQVLKSGAAEEDTISDEVEGHILSPVKVDGDRADFTMQVNRWGSNEELKEKVLVQVKLSHEEEQGTALGWKRGDRVVFNGSLERPGEARNFGGFDYRSFLRHQNIHFIVKTSGAQEIKTMAEEHNVISLWRWNDDLRSSIGGRIDDLFGGFHGGYMKGLIIGDRGDLDHDTFMEFSRLGLTHILAISGMHVAVYVGCLLFIFSSLRMTREASLTAVIFLLPLYVVLTGASPSVTRAGIMGMIGLYAARRGILKDGMHILSAAALMMLWYNPYYLVNVSFQLSFLVTAGLMIFVPKLMPLLSAFPKWLGGSLAVTAAAQMVSFPLTIYYFNQFSLLSLLANLLLVPLISLVVLPLGMICVLISIIWMQGAGWLAALIVSINNLTFGWVEWMNGSSAFLTIWPSPALWWIMMYFITLFLLLRSLNKLLENRAEPFNPDETVPLDAVQKRTGRSILQDLRRSEPHPVLWSVTARLRSAGFLRLARGIEAAAIPAVLPLAVIICLLLYTGYHSPYRHGAGTVQFLDVGQGDSILITTPSGRNLLVDGGGTLNFRKEKDAWRERKSPFEVGAKVVVPLLKKRGVHSLDMVMITHNDQDHAGGIQAVLEEIPVRAIVFNGTLTSSPKFEALMSTALRKGIPIYKAEEHSLYEPDADTRIQFLHPSARAVEDDRQLQQVKEQNHHSLVFLMKMNKARFLFSGDADTAAELTILHNVDGSLAAAALPVDVMKIGHHGSKTSTSPQWLEAWRPAAAVISAGVNNIYRHPHPDVVDRIIEHNVTLFRTDLHGETQIRVESDGKISVRTKLPPEKPPL
ncbi:DUF4131 domain-containing protein [Paenibacillus lemnae]|uniref:DUF4131 domain-containing protein n=2 Tax=Paenibacillus lemnae TaxID=1330551 RepID=A0A848M2T6_PAELE|nr:DUF4131 domain-containing protein [Paenibacillus lemnae]